MSPQIHRLTSYPLGPQNVTCSLQNCESINFCCLSCPVRGKTESGVVKYLTGKRQAGIACDPSPPAPLQARAPTTLLKGLKKIFVWKHSANGKQPHKSSGFNLFAPHQKYLDCAQQAGLIDVPSPWDPHKSPITHPPLCKRTLL